MPVSELLVQTVLLIGAPLAASRGIARWPRVRENRATVVSVSFFVLVTAIAGSTRSALLARPDLLGVLSVLALLRTFGVGGLVFLLSGALGASRETRLSLTAFASFKNLGLTVVLAFAYASDEAAIRDGWVLMAAVPPAVAVVPITGYLKGDTRRALVSLFRTRLERAGDRTFHGRIVVRIAEDLAPVDDHREAGADPVPQAEPHPFGGVHPDDFDPDSVPEIAEQVVRDGMRAVCVVEQ